MTVTAKNPDPEPATLKSIKVTSKPDKTTYTVDETFAKTGLAVTGTWSDGKTALLKDSEYKLSAVDADGKTGKDSAGTDGSYDGTPLEGKVNLQSSVGNVCKQAQSGAVDVAFVYSSDVYRFGGVKVIGVVPDDTHKNIIYPAAICKDSTQAEAANEFIEWATTNADAKKLWQEWGFELVS